MTMNSNNAMYILLKYETDELLFRVLLETKCFKYVILYLSILLHYYNFYTQY
jgi:hypothetical protein